MPPASYFSSSHVDNHTGEYVEDSISTVSHKSFSLWDRKTGVRSLKSEGDIEVRVKSTTFSGHGLRVLVGRPPGLAGFLRLRAMETWHFMSCVQGRRGMGGWIVNQGYLSDLEHLGWKNKGTRDWACSASPLSCPCCKVASVVSDSCDPMDCSLPGFSIHGILQATTLEWVAISFSTVLPLIPPNFFQIAETGKDDLLKCFNHWEPLNSPDDREGADFRF